MSDRILFIDVDGVLLPGRMHSSPTNMAARSGNAPDLPWSHLLGRIGRVCASECCPASVQRLRRLIENTGAELVLISSWRDAIGIPETLKILEIQGVPARWHADQPPWTDGSKARDIEAWLSRHPEVEAWAVLDDDMIWPPQGEGRRAMCRRHVRPNFVAGPSAAHWETLESLLLRPADPAR